MAVNGDTQLRREAIRQIERKRKLQAHVLGYLLLNAILIAIWAITEYQNAGGWPTGFRTGRLNHDWDPWIIYPLIGTTVGVGAHWWTTVGRRAPTEQEVLRKMDELGARRPPAASDLEGAR